MTPEPAPPGSPTVNTPWPLSPTGGEGPQGAGGHDPGVAGREKIVLYSGFLDIGNP